jgi:hypothetical protein
MLTAGPAGPGEGEPTRRRPAAPTIEEDPMSSAYLAACVLALLGPAADDAPKKDPAKPPPALADQIAAIAREHKEGEKKLLEDFRANRDDNAKIQKLNEEYQRSVQKQGDRLKALIKEHAQDPAVFEAFLVLVGELRNELDEPMLRLVREHHLANPKMGKLCFDLMTNIRSPGTAKLLEEVAAKHPQQAVRGQALFALGMFQRYKAHPWDEEVSQADELKRLAPAERTFREVVKTYAAVKTPDDKTTLGTRAGAELARIKNLPDLKVGKAAPDIAGEDVDGRPLKLSDYRGKVVVLDFWGNW